MTAGLALLRLAACALVASLLATTSARDAAADDAATATHEAARHFERAVTLYGETDYQGALVEFRRAYALSPNPTVLYNIGEAEFQLQDYAGALAAFSRYLAEAPPGAGRRGEVESNLEVLRGRVGHLGVVTAPPGADVAIDDVPIGKTPLAERAVVSVGHRKVAASLPGHPPVVRYVDVAADDNATVTLDLAPGRSEAATPLPATDRPGGEGTGPWRGGPVLRAIGWVATGMLAAGAAGAGILAIKESNDLKDARSTYPVSAATLQGDSDRVRTYSLVADTLTIAACVVGSVTLVSTVISSSGSAPTERTATVRASPASVDFAVTF